MVARLIRALPLVALVAVTACERNEPALNEALAASPSAALPAEAPTNAPADQAPTNAPLDEPSPNGVDDGHPNLLPASFPHDIPIPAGLVAQSVQSEHAGSYVALFTGEREPDVVYRDFEERLTAEGWTIDKARAGGPEYGLFAQKQDRLATVIATRIDGKLHVELGVYGGD
jgi:hypothetical protein